VPGAAAALVRVGWRVPPPIDGRGERLLELAAGILRTRLERDLHEGHPGARPAALETTVALPPGFRNRRWIGATLQVDPARAEEVARAVRGVIERLARQGPSAAELAEAQTIEGERKVAHGKAAHWATVLEGFDSRGQKRADLRASAADTKLIARRDIVDVLRRCVTERGRLQLIIVPST
jgi:plasmid stabilization system protein ParE